MLQNKILGYLKEPKIVFVILAFAVFLPYSNIFQNEFAYDDHQYFETWWGIKNFDIVRYFAGDHPAGFHHVYRPVRSIVQGIIYKMTGQNPFGYHFFALLFHFISAYLAYLIAKRITSNVAAVFAAIIFAALPVHTESVTFMTGSFVALNAVFIFLSLYLYIRFSESGEKKFFLLSLLAGTLAIFSHEMALVLPLLFILSDICFQNITLSKIASRAKYYLWFIFIAAFYYIIRTNILQKIYTVPYYQEIGFWERMLTMAKALMRYISLVILNYPLSVYHPIKISTSLDARVIASLLVVLYLMYIAYYFWKRGKKIYTFIILWFFIGLLPVSNIIQISSFVYEQYLYLASFAWALFLGYIFFHFMGKRSHAAFFLFILVSVAYGILTWKRNFDWRNDETLWKKTIIQHPAFARPYEQLGAYYKNKKDFANAEKYLAEGIAFAGDISSLFITVGDMYSDKGEYEKAIEEYKKGIQINPRNGSYYHNLGYAYLRAGKNQEAEENFRKAVEISPVFFDSIFNLAVLLLEEGKYSEAKSFFTKALELRKNDSEIYYGLGVSHAGLGDARKAREYLEKALEINPSFEPAREFLQKLK